MNERKTFITPLPVMARKMVSRMSIESTNSIQKGRFYTLRYNITRVETVCLRVSQIGS